MKVNKIFIKVSHFFGFNKDLEHIDDVTININSENYDSRLLDILLYSLPDKRYIFKGDDELKIQEIIADIKKTTQSILSTNPKLDKRCKNVKTVYLTFYKNSDKIKEGSILKELFYLNGKLFYTYDSKERELAIAEEKLVIDGQ